MLTNTYQRKRDEGFTIIEVLIVLAIAGLILLIVFLAVPALQRNARNTSRKSDVQAVLAGLQEYTNNNGGTLPANLAAFSKDYKVGFYTGASDITYTLNASQITTDPTSATNATANVVTIETYTKCNSTGTGIDTTSGDASSRNVAAFYYLEQGGGGKLEQCQDI